MWLKYADQYNGFCVIYDLENEEKRLCGKQEKCKNCVVNTAGVSLYPMYYSDVRYDATEYARSLTIACIAQSFLPPEIANLIIRLVRKPKDSMLKVINTANQRSSQAKSFSAVSVAGGKNTKAFDITVNVLNVDSTFGNHSVISLFFCGQFMFFRSLDGKSAVLVQSKHTQISFVSEEFYSGTNV